MTYWDRMYNFLTSHFYREVSKYRIVAPVEEAASRALGFNYDYNVGFSCVLIGLKIGWENLS